MSKALPRVDGHFFLTDPPPDVGSDPVLYDIESSVPLNVEGGSRSGDRGVWLDERRDRPIRETRQLYPGDTESISFSFW